MAIKEEDVRAILEQDEPDYIEAAKMGPEALPHLEVLVEDEDPAIASKAASLAGFIVDPGSVQVLKKAAASEEPVVRVAAAGAARELAGEAASEVLLPLVEDEDAGVQKTALKSLPLEASVELRARVESLAQNSELPQSTRELLSTMESETVDEDAIHVPELSPMPEYEGPAPGYSEALSADGMPGSTNGPDDLSMSSAVEQEMPGSTDGPAPSAAVEQEMPGVTDDSAPSAAVEAVEQEMPGVDDSALPGEMGSNEQEMP